MSSGVHDEPFLAHHFRDHDHQFRAGKFGLWLFLAQEILFFGGLFCAYFIFRNIRPDVFFAAHKLLDPTLGTINTAVLLFSSMTAAWSVRSAQLGNKRGLVISILLTIACAFGFLIIKYLEYSHKFHEGLLWGSQFAPSASALAKAGISNPDGLGTFFSIYYVMTGLHGVHVVGGIIVYVWLLRRALRGDFGPRYYGPVDFTALYWHLVDLVWIFLFPLLYLIH